MKLIIFFCLSLVIAPVFSNASNQQIHPEIIVTLPALSGLVTMLLPETQSTCLLSAGADPHHFQPSPKQIRLLNQGSLLVRASRDDQGWPIQVRQNQVLDLWTSENHAWLQFEQVRLILPRLALALTKQFPQHQQRIQARLPLALQTVRQLEHDWDKVFAAIKQNGVFMQHPAWHDLFENKNIPIWAVLESHQHGHEHGPRHLEKALKTLKKHPNALLLGSKHHSNRSLEWLSNHQNNPHSLMQLDALGSCNQPWDELMKYNLNILKGSL